MSTMFVYDDPEQGRRVLNMAVPIAAEGVTVARQLGHARHARHRAATTSMLEDVFVPDERVLANRPYGVVDPPLQVIASIAFPIISAVYLGVAEAAYDAALAAAAPKPTDPIVQRQIGLMRQPAAGRVVGARRRAGGRRRRPGAVARDRRRGDGGQARDRRRPASRSATSRWSVAGGAAFFKGSVIERAYRDIRAVKFHPLTPEAILLHAGRLALGQPCDQV